MEKCLEPFWCDLPVILSGVPYLNPTVLIINFKDYWKEECYPEILKLYISFLWEFSYNENTDKKAYQFGNGILPLLWLEIEGRVTIYGRIHNEAEG